MQAYKVNGKIDETGRLIVTEAIALHPGEVEVILLQVPVPSENEIKQTDPQVELPKRGSSVQAFQGLFEKTSPLADSMDTDEAKWAYLKEKYDL
ncbi:MAG: hypothetical protein F6K30_29370 [Cyanothece sp. SIO2G6]|nr:hypothetical protein [Cyanothece sp. SIO2G6]